MLYPSNPRDQAAAEVLRTIRPTLRTHLGVTLQLQPMPSSTPRSPKKPVSCASRSDSALGGDAGDVAAGARDGRPPLATVQPAPLDGTASRQSGFALLWTAYIHVDATYTAHIMLHGSGAHLP